MRRTIEITRHNCPADGDSITAVVTLDVSEGVTSDKTDDCASPTVTPVCWRVTKCVCCGQDWFLEDTEILEAILERDCDPVAMAIEKLTELQGSGGEV